MLHRVPSHGALNLLVLSVLLLLLLPSLTRPLAGETKKKRTPRETAGQQTNAKRKLSELSFLQGVVVLRDNKSSCEYCGGSGFEKPRHARETAREGAEAKRKFSEFSCYDKVQKVWWHSFGQRRGPHRYEFEKPRHVRTTTGKRENAKGT